MFNPEELHQLIIDGFIKVQKHPEHDLFIYNYTQKAQFERAWNPITMQCRGLILDKDGNVHARPFKKFFNLGEPDAGEVPNERFLVTEKLDGSLGILYWIDDIPYIASRGSFTSPQAERGTKILHEKYPHLFPNLDRTNTYLFEIIYPENRIVCDYGNTSDLVLLAIIRNSDGHEFALSESEFNIVPHVNIKDDPDMSDLMILKQLQETNKEGFVIYFIKSGLRLKVKFDEYVRIHRIVTQCSNVIIWEHLKDGKPLDELIDRVPDEFFAFVKLTVQDLELRYHVIESVCKNDFEIDFDARSTRKEIAERFLQRTYPSILFAMLDSKDYEPIIWKMIRPLFSKPFSTAGEEA